MSSQLEYLIRFQGFAEGFLGMQCDIHRLQEELSEAREACLDFTARLTAAESREVELAMEVAGKDKDLKHIREELQANGSLRTGSLKPRTAALAEEAHWLAGKLRRDLAALEDRLQHLIRLLQPGHDGTCSQAISGFHRHASSIKEEVADMELAAASCTLATIASCIAAIPRLSPPAPELQVRRFRLSQDGLGAHFSWRCLLQCFHLRIGC